MAGCWQARAQGRLPPLVRRPLVYPGGAPGAASQAGLGVGRLVQQAATRTRLLPPLPCPGANPGRRTANFQFSVFSFLAQPRHRSAPAAGAAFQLVLCTTCGPSAAIAAAAAAAAVSRW